jgi:hypothetical protein
VNNTRKFGWVTGLGVAPVFLCALFAGRWVYEQTVMTWRDGLQMVGFSLAHSGLAVFALLSIPLSVVWVVAILVRALRKPSRSSKIDWCLAAIAVGSWACFAVPYEQWKLLMVRTHGTAHVPGDWVTYAAATGETRLLNYLFAHGFDVNVRNHDGQSPLGAAAVEGRVDIARALLARGARVENRTAMLAETPLTQAAQMNQVEMVKLLLANGADSSYRDGTGRTAMDWAMKNGNSEMQAALQQQHALPH